MRNGTALSLKINMNSEEENNIEEDLQEQNGAGMTAEEGMEEELSDDYPTDEENAGEENYEAVHGGKKGFFRKFFNSKAEKELRAELDKQTKLAKEYYSQLLASKAEFENYRKRVERERPGLIQYGKAELLAKFLPMYDLMMSAGKHLESVKSPEMTNIATGLKMVFKEIGRIFDSEGMRPMDPVGKPYDPMATEIIGIIDGDESNDGLVVEELQKGFYLGDKILRTAKVKIARRKAEPAKPADNSSVEQSQEPTDKEFEGTGGENTGN